MCMANIATMAMATSPLENDLKKVLKPIEYCELQVLDELHIVERKFSKLSMKDFLM